MMVGRDYEGLRLVSPRAAGRLQSDLNEIRSTLSAFTIPLRQVSKLTNDMTAGLSLSFATAPVEAR